MPKGNVIRTSLPELFAHDPVISEELKEAGDELEATGGAVIVPEQPPPVAPPTNKDDQP